MVVVVTPGIVVVDVVVVVVVTGTVVVAGIVVVAGTVEVELVVVVEVLVVVEVVDVVDVNATGVHAPAKQTVSTGHNTTSDSHMSSSSEQVLKLSRAHSGVKTFHGEHIVWHPAQ